MLWVSFANRLKEKSAAFDVANVGVGGDVHAVQISQIPFGVHHCLPRDTVGDLIKLHTKHRTTRLTDSCKIRNRGCSSSSTRHRCGHATTWHWCLHATFFT